MRDSNPSPEAGRVKKMMMLFIGTETLVTQMTEAATREDRARVRGFSSSPGPQHFQPANNGQDSRRQLLPDVIPGDNTLSRAIESYRPGSSQIVLVAGPSATDLDSAKVY